MKGTAFAWFGVGIFVVLIGAGTTFFFLHRNAPVSMPVSTATTTSADAASSTIVDLGNGTSIKLPPGVKITPVPAPQEPDLNHMVVFSPELSTDTVATIKKDVPILTAKLKKDPSQGNDWLQLAMYYKIAGDNSAAETIWIYLTQAAPSSYVAFADLADLYMNFEKNYPKAEANYLQVIKLQPGYIQAYQDLFTLYRSFYKTNTSAAADIVAQGLKNNPNNPDLLNLQAQLKGSAQ